MKASSKILITGFLFSIIMLFLYYFNMRNAYQKALANPLAQFVKIDLKESKYLNISHHWNVNFKQAEKFQIQLQREYKDLLRFTYMGDSLNLDGRSAGEMTIFLPKLPKLTFNSEKGSELYVYIEDSFKAGLLDAKFLKACHFTITGSQLENLKINSNESLQLILENCDIKNLDLNLPKRSEITMNYSNIGSQNFILGDSCSVKVTGNYIKAIPGKYYGTTL